jgi:hypothetical protein
MSTLYGFDINIYKIPVDFIDKVINELNSIGITDAIAFTNKAKTNGSILDSYNEVELSGMDEPEAFVEKIKKTIWSIVGNYVEINIVVRYIEQVPTEQFDSSEEEYNSLMKG